MLDCIPKDIGVLLKKIPFKKVETPSDDARITWSAMRYGDVVYTHVRHSYALWAIAELKVYDRITLGKADQGFVDQYGNYFDRETSAKIAFKAKQIPESKEILFSEDIWHNDGSSKF